MRPHHKAEHMAAHDQIVKTLKTPCHAGAVHTRLTRNSRRGFVREGYCKECCREFLKGSLG
jgi:hypothetical protein